jgi:fibronectin type III domain protein
MFLSSTRCPSVWEEFLVRARHLSLRLAAAVFFPLALSGCELPTASADKEQEAAAPPANPPGNSWLLVEPGDRQEPEPVPAAVPVAEEIPEVLHVPVLPHVVHAEPVDPRCTGNVTPGKINPLEVDPGATTATVSWYHPGDPSVVRYRITSISQKLVVGRQAELEWQEIEPGEGCHMLTATVKNLQRDTPYVFSVDVVRTATWQNTTRAVTIARSGPVLTR